jgi:hypothetical protein
MKVALQDCPIDFRNRLRYGFYRTSTELCDRGVRIRSKTEFGLAIGQGEVVDATG